MNVLHRWFDKRRSPRPARRPGSRRSLPGLESLETRVVLYSATGNAWMNPQLVTLSFMPDGTLLGGTNSAGQPIVSNLQSTFNSKAALAASSGATVNGSPISRWEQQILLAAQTWAMETNINLEVVADDGTPAGGGSDQEGAPGMGDIRIGGYNYGPGDSTLAWSFQPPPVNNTSLAGDIQFNTGEAFNIGSTYDLYTVAAHEVGHALGLGESGVVGSIMYPTYTTKMTTVAADDILGIRSIYGGARAFDAYGGLNATAATAANLDSLISPNSMTGLAYNLDLAKIGQAEFFSVDVPAGVSGGMQVLLQSQGLSLLSPKVTVLGSNMSTVVGSASGLNQYGTTLTVNIPNAVAGQRYYIEVQGADSTAFSTGDYSLGLSFNGSIPAPTEASPMVTYANGNPISSGGGEAQQSGIAGGMVGAPPNILGITPDNGASPSDGITDVNRIDINGVAPAGETITVYNNGVNIGTTVADVNGNWAFDNTGTALPDGNYSFSATATDPVGNVSALSQAFGVTIITTPPAAPTIGGVVGTFTQNGNSAMTGDTTPLFYGTAAPFSQVTLYNGSTALGTAAADPNGHWNFTLPAGELGTFQSLSFTATATNVAGDVSSSSSAYSVTVLPSFLGSLTSTLSSVGVAVGSLLGVNADGSINTGTTVTLSGTASALAQVAIFEDGLVIGVASVGMNGSWSFTASGLTVGRHRLSFEGVNANGVLSSLVDALIVNT